MATLIRSSTKQKNSYNLFSLIIGKMILGMVNENYKFIKYVSFENIIERRKDAHYRDLLQTQVKSAYAYTKIAYMPMVEINHML